MKNDKPADQSKNEFDTFDAAIGKLFKVPKPEVEKRLADEKKHGKGKHRKAG